MKYTEKEQRQHRAELIKALRSGKYAQARGCLREGKSFCCLGVACDISGINEWMNDYENFYRYFDSIDILPEKVRSYYGFVSADGGFNYLTRSTSLSALNDNGHSFEQIANIIEKEPRGLFS